MEHSPQTAQTQEAPQRLELTERVGIVEAILFVTGNAVEKKDICRAMGITEPELDETLDALESGYDFERRGLRLLRFGAHVQLATRPDYAPYVEKLLQPVQKQSLSQAVMETLAVIAYKQPVTKAEIEQIRGVKCDYSVQSLAAKGLIAEGISNVQKAMEQDPSNAEYRAAYNQMQNAGNMYRGYSGAQGYSSMGDAAATGLLCSTIPLCLCC